MFIVNQSGRVVDLPEEMEEAGFRQAREVLSISDSLMDYGKYERLTSQGVLISKSGMNLKNDILAKFPNVIRDSEYIEKFVNKKEINLKEEKNETKPRRNDETTKVSRTRQKNR